jgi:outer membrane lipoprotein-sorting protein
MEHDSGGDIISPNKLLTIYEGDYKYTYVDTKLINGKQLQMINLFPKESQELIKINIAVDTIKNQLERMSIYDKDGGIYTYLIKSFKSNTNTKPFIFNISDFPGIEVIDLR